MVASEEVMNLFSVTARTLVCSEIDTLLGFLQYYEPVKYEGARNPQIRLLVARNLHQHSFRVHRNAASLKALLFVGIGPEVHDFPRSQKRGLIEGGVCAA